MRRSRLWLDPRARKYPARTIMSPSESRTIPLSVVLHRSEVSSRLEGRWLDQVALIHIHILVDSCHSACDRRASMCQVSRVHEEMSLIRAWTAVRQLGPPHHVLHPEGEFSSRLSYARFLLRAPFFFPAPGIILAFVSAFSPPPPVSGVRLTAPSLEPCSHL